MSIRTGRSISITAAARWDRACTPRWLRSPLKPSRLISDQGHEDDGRESAKHLCDRRLLWADLNGMANLNACEQIKARLIRFVCES
jgi:hypothetical protein